MIDKLNRFLATFPSTNGRIVATLGLVIATGLIYLALAVAAATNLMSESWEPSWEWLAFLTALSGVDSLQHFTKRKTTWQPKESAVASSTTTHTDSPTLSG